ncbi:MAG TPA: CPBP family intramembrane metalloprotease [Candidatus Omnitrophota bacterium]|nr:CPBP family intramembrane metalloprotease [Candidatus Omnitrophota bacterium]
MIKDICHFFKTEKKYFWLLLAIFSFYAFFLFGSQSRNHHAKLLPSKEIVKFNQTEQKWDAEMSREQGFAEFARRQPRLAFLFEIMVLFFAGGFLVGCVIDVLFLASASFRGRWESRSPPGDSPKTFSILLKVVILFVFWGIALSFLMGIIETVFPKGVSENFFMILHTLIMNLVCFYFMIRFVKHSGGKWQDLGLSIPDSGLFREVWMGIVGYFSVLPVFLISLVILFVIANMLHYEPPAHPIVNVFLEEEKRSPLLMVASILLGTLIGPIFEEIFFRGLCYPILKNRWGKFWGMVLSAAFFAGIHYSGFVFWPIFILGIALAYLYEKRRSLIAPMTFHVVNNTIFIFYFFLIKQVIGVKLP